MKDKILEYINDHIEDCEILLKQASGTHRELVLGCLNTCEDIKEFIEGLNDAT